MHLQSCKFLQLGSLIAMGIGQGGNGFPFLSPPVHNYLCGVELQVTITKEHVPTIETRVFMTEVFKTMINLYKHVTSLLD